MAAVLIKFRHNNAYGFCRLDPIRHLNTLRRSSEWCLTIHLSVFRWNFWYALLKTQMTWLTKMFVKQLEVLHFGCPARKVSAKIVWCYHEFSHRKLFHPTTCKIRMVIFFRNKVDFCFVILYQTFLKIISFQG